MPVPFEKLYPKQKEAIRWGTGPLLVLAGPGTGKTEVLTHRIIYLVRNKSVDRKEILGITFSRKAANQMIERLKEFTEFEKNRPRISTLHAEALRILGEMASSNKFLLDVDETHLLMMDAAQDLDLDLRGRQLREMERRISLLKAENKLPNELTCFDGQTLIIRRLYERYEQLLTLNRAIDLDGLIMRVVRVLSSIGLSCESKVRHVLVDEYQDINQAEFMFIQILAKNADSLFVVGDDDQSIYGWRGADPSIIRNFQKDYQGAQVEILEESRRCTGNVLKGAQAIVSKDPNYQFKPLLSVKGDGSPIHVLVSKSWTVEALWIVRWIEDSLSKGFVRPCDIVILCKNLNLADALADQLRISRIDTVYWRSRGLFTPEIVRDVLAHVRLLVDKEDNLALRRCIDTPTGYGIGRTGMLTIRRIAEKHSFPLWKVLTNANKHAELKKWRTPIERFVGKVQDLENKSAKLKLDETIHLTAREIKVSGRIDIDRLKDFAGTLQTDNLEDFLLEVNKNRGLDLAGGVPEPEEEKEAVTIMSMHSAKGLEYDVAFLLGMDQGILPDPIKEMNEQRRLCYVAMTRTKRELFLCHSRMRKGPVAHGWSYYNPSQFLLEIPRENREVQHLT